MSCEQARLGDEQQRQQNGELQRQQNGELQRQNGELQRHNDELLTEAASFKQQIVDLMEQSAKQQQHLKRQATELVQLSQLQPRRSTKSAEAFRQLLAKPPLAAMLTPQHAAPTDWPLCYTLNNSDLGVDFSEQLGEYALNVPWRSSPFKDDSPSELPWPAIDSTDLPRILARAFTALKSCCGIQLVGTGFVACIDSLEPLPQPDAQVLAAALVGARAAEATVMLRTPAALVLHSEGCTGAVRGSVELLQCKQESGMQIEPASMGAGRLASRGMAHLRTQLAQHQQRIESLQQHREVAQLEVDKVKAVLQKLAGHMIWVNDMQANEIIAILGHYSSKAFLEARIEVRQGCILFCTV